MRWLKRDRWKAGIALAGMLLLLVLMVWVPVSAAGAYEGTSGLATPVTGTVQATPTVDATVTALSKEQLTQQITQQQHTWVNWLWNNTATVLSSVLSSLVIIIGVLIGFRQWSVSRKDTQSKESEDRRTAQDKELEDRKAEREKRAEERFQAAIEGLSSEREQARIGAAILLRTFLRPGYEQFYTQTFDLAVANLRPDPIPPLPLTTLNQALIVVFKEAFPLARSQNQRGPQSLDARSIQLDNAYLSEADLKQVWMPQASLRNANLSKADLSGADLRQADLREAKFGEAKLIEADLSGADLSGANLGTNVITSELLEVGKTYILTDIWLSLKAKLSGADDFIVVNLSRTKLVGAKLIKATLSYANLQEADLTGAHLYEANLFGADLSGANLRDTDLSRSNIETALSLKSTDLRRAKGLTEDQLKKCKDSGAIIDKDSATSSRQSTVALSPLSQCTDAQAPSAPPAQVNTPSPDTGGNGATSSQQDPEP